MITQWTIQNTQLALTISTSSIASVRRSDGRHKISRARNFPRTSSTFSTGLIASKREREQRPDIPPMSDPSDLAWRLMTANQGFQIAAIFAGDREHGVAMAVVGTMAVAGPRTAWEDRRLGLSAAIPHVSALHTRLANFDNQRNAITAHVFAVVTATKMLDFTIILCAPVANSFLPRRAFRFSRAT